MAKQVYEQEFKATGPAHLSLRNIRGKISVRPAHDGKVAVTAIKHLDSGDPERTEVEMWQSDAGNVFVATRFKRTLGSKPCRVDYDVRLPAPSTVALRCVSGGVLLEQLEGNFRLKMVSGAVKLKGLAGSLWVRTVSGDIIATQLDGRLHLETVSGNVHVQAARLETVEAKTVNSNLVLETPLSDGPYSFQTVSGEMRLLLPADTNCTVEMESLSGLLRVDGVERRATPFARRQQAALGGGGTLVRFKSVSGDFAVG